MSPWSLFAPSIATIQCTGRTNSSRLAPQRMRLGMGSACTASVMMPLSASSALTPATVVHSPSRWPFGVSMVCNCSGSTPCFLAKPLAAGVQLPSSSRARSTGGPSTSTFFSGACNWTSAINTARRLGVANHCTLPWPSSRWRRPSTMPSRKARPSDFSALGGSSSVPNSTSKVSVLMVYLASA